MHELPRVSQDRELVPVCELVRRVRVLDQPQDGAALGRRANEGGDGMIRYDPEERGHRMGTCRRCGYMGWSDDCGNCPRCEENEREHCQYCDAGEECSCPRCPDCNDYVKEDGQRCGECLSERASYFTPEESA